MKRFVFALTLALILSPALGAKIASAESLADQLIALQNVTTATVLESSQAQARPSNKPDSTADLCLAVQNESAIIQLDCSASQARKAEPDPVLQK